MEINAASHVTSDYGTIYFNDLADSHSMGGILHMTAMTGADGADVRSPVDNRPQRDGGIVHAAYRGPRHFTLEGTLVADTPTARVGLEDLVRGVTNAMLRRDGRFTWSPPGHADRFITCRLAGPVEFQAGPGLMKTFVIPLVSEDPIAYGAAQTVTDIPAGTSAVIHNGGNTETWPVLQAYGDYSDWQAINSTEGQEIDYDGGTVLAPHYAEVINFRETVFKDGSGANLLRYILFDTTDFWTLQPGDNTVSFESFSGGSAFLRVLSNDGWV